MIIKKLILNNWKNFRNCEVDFQNRCFVIGPNAAGKSNLIDALRFLRDISKEAGGLQSAVKERGGISRIRSLSARKEPTVSITIETMDEDTLIPIWKYQLSISQTGGGINPLFATVEQEVVYSYKLNKNVLERFPSKNSEDDEMKRYTFLEQVNSNREFRELQQFFRDLEYLNLIPQLVRESASVGNISIKEDHFGRSFLGNVAKLNERTRSSYFKRINEALKIAVPQLEELKFVKDEVGKPHLEARYIHWRAKGSKQQEVQFSDGTLRLIGLLFVLFNSKGVVLLEEPEINLNPAIVSRIPEFIAMIIRSGKGCKQVIITTHSYDLLTNQGVSLEEVVVLSNSSEGSIAFRAIEKDTIKAVVDSGFSIAEAVLPATKPANIENFDELRMD